MYFAINKKASPEALAIFGVLAVLLSSIIGFLSIRELVVLPSKPQHMLISEALLKVSEKPLWVILDDIYWSCDNVFYFEGNKTSRTYIVFTDKNKIVLGLALFSGKQDCQSIVQSELDGVLDIAIEAKNGELYKLLTENGFDLASHEKNRTFLSLCTYCGRSNSFTGVILSIIFFIIGILLFVPLAKEVKARKNANHFMKRKILRQ